MYLHRRFGREVRLARGRPAQAARVATRQAESRRDSARIGSSLMESSNARSKPLKSKLSRHARA